MSGKIFDYICYTHRLRLCQDKILFEAVLQDVKKICRMNLFREVFRLSLQCALYEMTLKINEGTGTVADDSKLFGTHIPRP